MKWMKKVEEEGGVKEGLLNTMYLKNFIDFLKRILKGKKLNCLFFVILMVKF